LFSVLKTRSSPSVFLRAFQCEAERRYIVTLVEFEEILGQDAKEMSPKEIEDFYTASVGFFNILFNKWKKEKLALRENVK
jgi:hypothetical protein